MCQFLNVSVTTCSHVLLRAEAVFLGMLLTQGWTQLQRLPLGFKSRGSDGKVSLCGCVAAVCLIYPASVQRWTGCDCCIATNTP